MDIVPRIDGLLHEGARDPEFRAAAVATANAIRKHACAGATTWMPTKLNENPAGFSTDVDHCIVWPDGLTKRRVRFMVYAYDDARNGSTARWGREDIFVVLNMFAAIKALLKKSGWKPPDGVGGYEKGSKSHPENVLSGMRGPKPGLLDDAWNAKVHVTLTHELTHLFDICRLSDPLYSGTHPTNADAGNAAYFKSPLEFNAFYQSIFAAMEKQVAKAKTFQDAMLVFASTGAMRKSGNAPSFVLALLNDPKMRRKFAKRLYVDWQRLRSA